MPLPSSSSPVITTMGKCGAAALICATVSRPRLSGRERSNRIASNDSSARRLTASAIISTCVTWNDSSFTSASMYCSSSASAAPSSTNSKRMGSGFIGYSSSGSLTTVSQKFSIDFTTSMKRLKSTGLVM